MMALSLLLMQRAVVDPILMTFGFDSFLSTLEMLFMLLSVLLIAAGGYVINDYFDIKIDAINKPDSRIVGNALERKKAIIIHQVLSVIGALLGIVLSLMLRSFTVGLLYVLVPGLLWFYSASYKRQFIIGNLIVAFNSALSILIVALVNVAKLKLHYQDLIYQTPIAHNIYAWVGGFALFAFLITIIREIIKDMEDEEGDREFECHTLPIQLGVGKTKIIIYILVAVVLAALAFVNFRLIPFQSTLTDTYFYWGMLLPFVIFVLLLAFAKTKRDFAQASAFVKFIMLIGLLYSVVFYYLQAQTYGFPFFGLYAA